MGANSEKPECGLVHAEIPGVLSVGAEILISGNGVRISRCRGILVRAGSETDGSAAASRDGDKAGFRSTETKNDTLVRVVPDGNQRLEHHAGAGGVGLSRSRAWGTTAGKNQGRRSNQECCQGARE